MRLNPPHGRTGLPAPDAPRQARPGGQAGFTLLELAFVMLIMGLAVGLALPAINAVMGSESDRSTVRRITGLVHRGMTDAILSGEAWQLTIDPGKSLAVMVKRGAPMKSSIKAERLPLPAAFRPEAWLTPVGQSKEEGKPLRIDVYPVGLVEPFLLVFPEKSEAGGKKVAVMEAVGSSLRFGTRSESQELEAFRKRYRPLLTPWASVTSSDTKDQKDQ
ncbi:pilus assembly FimT family protein [Fundidesulfovibrio agrisoli]|uniref:pilus assembly FimT family protein n=1 Tax=Fundidesulfovibrio agrisoli TaxID=2922717 RepID=UPI001FAC9EFD|nr:prepilin-type N-terminal cleavage/methylation domain-containing protein [Fundidesulfovibrio agrisoli]